jgi:hypothetical protein
MSGRFLYVFLDEAGNFDFSPGGTKYFILSAVSKERPFQAYQEMTELKYNRKKRPPRLLFRESPIGLLSPGWNLFDQKSEQIVDGIRPDVKQRP